MSPYDVQYLMDAAIGAVSPSNAVSSYIKADVIKLLERLRDAEILRIVTEEAKKKRSPQ